ncbi:hypothetical protein A2Y85_07720 [candidate division WOR-3 bacterium RBG_13_43_14]|uniref:Archease domain-containing protein n=1 Tax=candidate division WOR-3 bacterium RBG_13_43_14 TaxID=1802590 RepID=A0A1F4UAW9_UNCW3|nr:MAG: hypothetical protein A2Y85_07720 [candidate division WOR-3 bacterium RBG_13_43_14]
MKKKYQYFDHTADLGIEIYGDNLKTLFENAGHAIFETQIIGDIKATREQMIELETETLDDLLIDWCRELLYLFSVHQFIPCDYSIDINDYQLCARVKGEKYDQTRHKIRMEIKNITYHNFKIDFNENEYKATIVFDV